MRLRSVVTILLGAAPPVFSPGFSPVSSPRSSPGIGNAGPAVAPPASDVGATHVRSPLSSSGVPVRVVVGSAPHELALAPGGGWVARDAWGREHARGSAGDRGSTGAAWRVERRNLRLRLVSADGRGASAWSDAPFVVTPEGEAPVSHAGRHYRGALAYVATDTAILVVNRVALEDYLRGVVPVEIGSRPPNDSAAVQAQAVAARSYTVVRQREGSRRPYDLTSAASDQVYGGADVEQPRSDAAIAATAGVVLTFGGRVVRAPYHSTCGGRTAAPSEVWEGGTDEGYLRSVSDRVPGAEGSWCDISPRFHWERVLTRTALEEAVERYVRGHGTGMIVAGGGVRGVRVEQKSPSGRVATLLVETDGGTLRLRGNAIRYALRSVGGEILNSTYFSLEPVIGRDGRLMQLTVRGAGNGHGVGMCQWGAIGRARAGHDVEAILAAYYPGTTLARLP